MVYLRRLQRWVKVSLCLMGDEIKVISNAIPFKFYPLQLLDENDVLFNLIGDYKLVDEAFIIYHNKEDFRLAVQTSEINVRLLTKEEDRKAWNDASDRTDEAWLKMKKNFGDPTH